MSLIVVHLRWDHVGPGQYEQLCRALPDGVGRPAGCLHRRRQRQGDAVLATEVWADAQQAGVFLTALPNMLRSTGLGEPQRVAFAVPDGYAAGYGVHPARKGTAVAAGPVIPTPRVAEERSLSPAPVPPATRRI